MTAQTGLSRHAARRLMWVAVLLAIICWALALYGMATNNAMLMSGSVTPAGLMTVTVAIAQQRLDQHKRAAPRPKPAAPEPPWWAPSLPAAHAEVRSITAGYLGVQPAPVDSHDGRQAMSAGCTESTTRGQRPPPVRSDPGPR